MTCYDVVVVGGGHAGCEAAAAAARSGCATLLVTADAEQLASPAGMPHLGENGRYQLLAELDVLGALQPRVADASLLKIHPLNERRGPATRGLRAQLDVDRYVSEMTALLQATPNLAVQQAVVVAVVPTTSGWQIATAESGSVYARTVIVAAGTWLDKQGYQGSRRFRVGADTRPLLRSLAGLGLPFTRFRTGLPPLLDASTVDVTVASAVQWGSDEELGYSWDLSARARRPPTRPSYLAYSTAATALLIRQHAQRIATLAGRVPGPGPQHCPSFELRVVRGVGPQRIWLQYMGAAGDVLYPDGLFMSSPVALQQQIVCTIPALREARIVRPGYAVSFSVVAEPVVAPTLAVRGREGLYLAGQLLGTDGPTESAAQGLIAGLNAARFLAGQPPLVLRRDQAYIGVLLDDLARSVRSSPQRMETTRAEHRAQLGPDTARARLAMVVDAMTLKHTDNRISLLV